MSQKKAFIDISQDLLDLAVLAEKFVSQEPGFFINTEMIPKARRNSDMLLKMISRKEVSKTNIQERCNDKCQSLKATMRVIRTTGKIAFSENPRRRKAYAAK